MGYQIVRAEKLKSFARVAQRLRHALRDHVPANADPNKLKTNTYSVPGAEGAKAMALPSGERSDRAMAKLRASLPPKYRKDAVLAVEFFVGFSPEDMNRVLSMGKAEKKYFFYDAQKWLTQKYGGEKNVLAWSIHADEKTPHMSFFIVPKVGDRLSAKHYIDGPKDLAKLQTDFHKEVAEKYGLDRGRFKSPAVHTSVKEFYALGEELMRQKQAELEAKKLKAREKKSKDKDGLER
jgi:hypothetical protein